MQPEATGPFEARAEHGFAPVDERERLLATYAALVCKRGYWEVDLASASVAAGLPATTGAELFATKEECYLAAVARSAEKTFSSVAAAFVAAGDNWAEGVHASVGALLAYAAAAPEFVQLALIECHTVGPRAVQATTQIRIDAMAFLEPGFAATGGEPPPRGVGEIVSGGVFDVIRRYCAEGRLAELPATLPAMSMVTLAPFVGRNEALRISQLPVA